MLSAIPMYGQGVFNKKKKKKNGTKIKKKKTLLQEKSEGFKYELQ